MDNIDNNRWLLPAGTEDILPDQAERLEQMRRNILDLLRGWGYRLTMPPFIEYLDSLLIGTGKDLDLQTFKLTDQLTGRLMGIRADMTPQVARIDAHHLKREEPVRLCYMGTVLHTLPGGFSGTRSPMQIGAELYGHPGIESDVEVLALMLEVLALAGVEQVFLDLGHVGIFRGLMRRAGLCAGDEATLFDALQRKAKPEIGELIARLDLDSIMGNMLLALADLNGGEDILAEARPVLQAGGAEVLAALDNLQQIATLIKQRLPGLQLHFDLAELRGYHYHTGAVFAAYAPGQGQAIAQGGRYDEIGGVYGRARPATGFSTDLKTLAMLGQPLASKGAAIFAPALADPALADKIRELRATGEQVIGELPGQPGGAREMGCDRILVKQQGAWAVSTIENR